MADRPGEEIAFLAIVGAVRRQWQSFVAISLLVLLIAVAYSVLVRPTYRAEVVLAPASTDSSGGLMQSLGGQLGQFASLAGISLEQNSELQTHLAILESNEFTKRFILDHDLLPTLYADRWDTASGTWKEGEQLSMWEVLDDFRNKVRTVRFDQSSNLVRLRVDWYDGDIAAEWANLMAEALNRVTRERAIEEANKSITYLRSELEKSPVVGVEQSIYRLIESQIGNIMLANVRKEYAFRVIDPAIAPAPDAQIRPNRPLIIAVGLVLGLALGIFAAVARDISRDE